MRFAPAAAALSLVVLVQASVGMAGDYKPDPRAEALVAEGRAILSGGDAQGAVDAFEAALAIDPGYAAIFVDLGEAARANGLQGKAIRYYREALARDPENLAAITGEGEAMVEKGAVAKARENLAKLQILCGSNCSETRELAAAIDRGPPVMTAEAVTPAPGVTQK